MYLRSKVKLALAVLLCCTSASLPGQTATVIDLGTAPAATPIRRIQLVLARSAVQQDALIALLGAQHDPRSPDYHRWLTPADFGARFGPSDGDLAALTTWLTAQGFTNLHLSAGRTTLEFSGTAASVSAAFHADIHSVQSSGQTFFANRAEPIVPAVLAHVVAGIPSLANLPRQPAAQPVNLMRRDNKSGTITAVASAGSSAVSAHPNWTLVSNGTTYYPVTPRDFAAIYNVLPLWNAASPIDGTGQAIAVAGDSDINPADFVNFRTLFSLPLGNTSSQTGTQYLNIIYNGPQPPVTVNEFHADSDTQWSAAVAKGAVIDYVASETTEASSGVDLSAAYIVDNNLAPILVDSYSRCESALGAAGNLFYNNLWQQAAAQGISVVAATGDSGDAACDLPLTAPASQGLAVNGVASTPWNVAVGGTDFYAPSGLGSYFGANGSQAASYQSVTGYIPELVWNDTCTNPAILAQTPYIGLTAEQACNSDRAKSAGLVVVAGSGGGASATYAKPIWQSGLGVPADSRRDTPDVALFVSKGRNNSFYVVCQQSRDTDGKSCNLADPYADFAGYGGTELAAPAFAGILAMTAQRNGARLGNPNFNLYKLAAAQVASGLNCSATGPSSALCVFHDVTFGTNTMPCTSGSVNCTPSNSGDLYGILATPAAAAGYDLATGLGSVDATNLVTAWTVVNGDATYAVLNVTPSQVVHGQPITANVTVTASNSFNPLTGEVSLNGQVGNGSVGAGPLTNGVFSQTFRNFPGGSYGISAHYAGDPVNAPTDSNFVSITVTPEPSTVKLSAFTYDPVTGVATPVTSAPYGDILFIRTDAGGVSGQGIATGNVTLTDNGNNLGSGVYRFNSSSYTEAQFNSVTGGTHSFVASYTGDASFNPGTSTPFALTVAQAPTTATVTPSASTVSVASTVTFSALVSTRSVGFKAPTGVVAFYSGTQWIGASVLVEGPYPTNSYRYSTATLTVSAELLPLGTSTLTVHYTGDTNYLTTTSPGSLITVTNSTLSLTSTTLTVTPSTVAPNGSISLFASIAAASQQANASAIGGAIQFVVDGQNAGAPVPLSSAATASFVYSVAALLVGQHTAIAVYTGDALNYRSSQSVPTPFVIANPGNVAVPTFVATPATAVQGTFIAVAVTLPNPAATGTVQLILDGGPYGAAIPIVNGVAVLPLVTSTIQVGAHVLTVFYSGDTAFTPSYAVASSIAVTAPGIVASSVALSMPPSLYLGSNAIFTAAVTPSSPRPTGIFQITLDSGLPGAPILLNGTSTSLAIPSTKLALGAHTVTVFYSGDAYYNFSTSKVIPFTVTQPVDAGSFTLTPASTTLTVARTTNPTIAYMATPINGFNSDVTFSCANLPGYTTCLFTPATVSTNGAPGTTILTVVMNTGLHGYAPAPPSLRSTAPVVLFAGLLCLLLPRRTRTRGIRLLLAIVLSLASLASMTGCNNGYTFGTTPSGSFAIQVNATGGGITQSATLTLNVE